MTRKSELDEVIRKRLKSIKEKPTDNTEGAEKPEKAPESDEEVEPKQDPSKAHKKALKAKRKRLKGYVNKQGGKNG